jgi:chemotaxis regulatin CheY-phosphate phosphatase CheZ
MQLTDKLRVRNVGMPLRAEPFPASTQSLRQVIADLSLLNHDTEQGFMSIGGKLAEFMQAVSVISSELTTLANAEHGQQAAQALTHALDRSKGLKASLGERNGGLADMRREVGLLKRTLSGFQETVSTFRTLGLLTRIETARLGSTGVDFSDLADDVSLLAGQIDTRVEGSLAIADSLIPPIEAAMQEASVIQARHAKDLPALISETLVSLSSFRDMQGKAHESSVRLASQYGAISDSFKKLIVSIQFHDITRQQVEHVIEVLQHLDAEPGGKDHGASRNTRSVAQVLALQAAQLADANEKFTASVASVERNLEGIARHVLEMVDESRALAGLRNDEKGSLFLPLEQHCRTILAGLGEAAKAEAAAQSTKEGLADNLGRMRGSIQEIQQTEPKMRKMALNARISAFHLGATGSALDVLAGSVQQLASECRDRSESLVASLGSMSEAAKRSRGEYGPDPAGERANGDECTDDLRLAVEELHSATEINFAQISQIVAHGDRLAEDLSATRMDFSVGRLFAEAVARAQGTIKDIGESAQSVLPRGDGENSDSGLADFVSHYTMQAELDVHESVTRAVARTASDTAQVDGQNSPPGETDEFGDNVEFF